MVKINYHEGTVFAIPLREGGYAKGLVTRCNGEGLIFAYFFGPKGSTIEALPPNHTLKPSNSILNGKCGDLGLINGEWKILGRVEAWNRNQWPFPFFTCDANDPKKITIVEYDEDTFATKTVQTVLRSDIDWQNIPIDRVMGYGSVEIRLTRMLAEP